MTVGVKETRRRNLLLLAGDKYFRYYAKRGRIVKALEKLLREAPEDPYGAEAFGAVVAQVALHALEVLRRAVIKARRDKLVYREFGVVYDRDLVGALDVARSVAARSSGLYASLTYLPSSLNAPEYLLLRKLVKRSVKTAKKLAELLESSGQATGEINNKIREVKRLSAPLPRGVTWLTCRDAGYVDWLRHACVSHRVLRGLLRGVGVARRAKEGLDVVFLDWRLYEIYIYSLLYETMKELDYAECDTRLCRGGDLCFERGTQRVCILFNKPHESSIVTSYDGEPAERLRGRPDAMIHGGQKIVVEAKFSSEPQYITLGRFKAMAYVYEYGADAGLLVFPDIEDKKTDLEDEATLEIYRYMQQHDGTATVKLRDGRKIHLIRVDPAEGSPSEADKKAKTRLTKILTKYVAEKQDEKEENCDVDRILTQ
ncbi:hypothetical protein PYWP30_00381 [Pyrobaculum sp. WP30]|nr:hypothetical protein PYWP30_00381 [Pyrobaculum sp. WP30]